MKSTLAFSIVVSACAAVANVSAFGCKPDEVKGWMASCDSLVNISQIRCDNRACHTALHRLVEQETLDCYASSGLGPASDLVKYKTLDDFCHGEGPDPNAPTTAPVTVTPTTQPPPSSPVPNTPPTPSTPSASPAPATPSPNGTAPVATSKPQC